MRKDLIHIRPTADRRQPARARAKAIAASKADRAAWVLQVTGMTAVVLMIAALLIGR